MENRSVDRAPAATPPVSFLCTSTIPRDPEEIAGEIATVERWSEFRGWGPLPGIESASWETRTDEMVGSTIRVRNRDGSSHIEEILEWQPSRRIVLRLRDFSAPLNRLATHFEETWSFASAGDGTRVERELWLHPRSRWTRLPMFVIAILLERAIARHLDQMKKG